jgi:hypothetical protein
MKKLKHKEDYIDDIIDKFDINHPNIEIEIKTLCDGYKIEQEEIKNFIENIISGLKSNNNINIIDAIKKFSSTKNEKFINIKSEYDESDENADNIDETLFRPLTESNITRDAKLIMENLSNKASEETKNLIQKLRSNLFGETGFQMALFDIIFKLFLLEIIDNNELKEQITKSSMESLSDKYGDLYDNFKFLCISSQIIETTGKRADRALERSKEVEFSDVESGNLELKDISECVKIINDLDIFNQDKILILLTCAGEKKSSILFMMKELSEPLLKGLSQLPLFFSVSSDTYSFPSFQKYKNQTIKDPGEKYKTITISPFEIEAKNLAEIIKNQEKDDKYVYKIGLQLGFPKTAVEAYENNDCLPEKKRDNARENLGIPEGFVRFGFSESNWEEEVAKIAKWHNKIKDYIPPEWID